MASEHEYRVWTSISDFSPPFGKPSARKSEREPSTTTRPSATCSPTSRPTEYDGLEGQLLEDGAIRPQLSVLKNGRNVVHMSGVETALEAGDVVSVFPPVAGG